MRQSSSRSSAVLRPWSVRMVDSTLQRYALEQAIWHYEHGLQVLAIQRAAEISGDARYLRFVSAWIDNFVTADGSIRTYRMDEYNLDQVNAGKLLFAAWKRAHDERYRKALHLLREQLKQQPRTPSRGFWHKRIYPDQMWLDGIYMAGPFLAEYAHCFDEPAAFDDVVHQILLIYEHACDANTGLLYHAWDERRQQAWCNPLTGCSKSFWGRGMGWFVMAIVDILEHLPPKHARRQRLIDILNQTTLALLKVQDEATGLWYQVLDLPHRKGNYLEASASAMFIYAFAKAVRQGHLPSDLLLSAGRAYNGLLQNLVKIDPLGLLTLENVCGGAGLGGTPYRDGSYEYYVSEKIVPNDPKGVGPFILAALEVERAGLNGMD